MVAVGCVCGGGVSMVSLLSPAVPEGGEWGVNITIQTVLMTSPTQLIHYSDALINMSIVVGAHRRRQNIVYDNTRHSWVPLFCLEWNDGTGKFTLVSCSNLRIPQSRAGFLIILFCYWHVYPRFRIVIQSMIVSFIPLFSHFPTLTPSLTHTHEPTLQIPIYTRAYTHTDTSSEKMDRVP